MAFRDKIVRGVNLSSCRALRPIVYTAKRNLCHSNDSASSALSFSAIISTETPVNKHFVEASINSLLMLVLWRQNVLTSLRAAN